LLFVGEEALNFGFHVSDDNMSDGKGIKENQKKLRLPVEFSASVALILLNFNEPESYIVNEPPCPPSPPLYI
jgi:hypothetical protein